MIESVLDSSALNWNEMPKDMRETFILSGYRPPCTSFYYGMKSAFTLHNETLNVWTHTLPLFYFMYYVFMDGQIWERLDTLEGSHKYTFYGYFAGLCILFSTSSMAHLLNCAWSRCWRNVCFVLDYAAITVFGVSAAIVYYFFLRPQGEVASMGGASRYLGMVVTTAVLAMFTCCWTRLKPFYMCNALRTAAFSLPFLLGSYPGFARYLTVLYPSSVPVSMENNTLVNQNIKDLEHPDDLFLQRFPRHMSLMVAGSIINAVKVPERFFPGSFDLVGHSHQIFHIFIFLGIREHFWIIFDDIVHPHSHLRIKDTSEGSSPFLTLSTLTILTAVVITIIVWFAFSIPENTEDEDQYTSVPATKAHGHSLSGKKLSVKSSEYNPSHTKQSEKQIKQQ